VTTHLTPRDRVLMALAFQETDLVPYHLMMDERVQDRLCVYFKDDQFEKQVINHLPFFNLEPKTYPLSDTTYVDVFGCKWRSGNFPHLEEVPLKEPSFQNYKFPELVEEDTFTGVDQFFQKYNQHFTLCGIAHGFFDRGWALRGMENFLVDFVAHPLFVEELFEVLTEIYLEMIDLIARYPFDGIRFGDDWGHQRGVLIGVSRWRKFVKPGLRKIFSRARDKGLAVMVHSDGDVSELIPDLIEIGVQVLNPLQPEAMDILEIKRLYGRDLCFNGGISTQLTLPRGTPQDVRREVAACLKLLGKGGGYVISPAKAILPDVPLENAAALIDALTHQAIEPFEENDWTPETQAAVLKRVYSEYHPKMDLVELGARRQVL
jgi:uroporphyrinogen decarboxylase